MENQKSDKDDKDVLPRKFTHVIFDMDGLILGKYFHLLTAIQCYLFVTRESPILILKTLN